MLRRIRIVPLAVLLAAALCVAPSTPALADGPTCSLGDLKQGAVDSYNDFLSQCADQFSDPLFYPLLAFIGAAAATPQGHDFCHGLIDIDTQIKNAPAQYANAKGDINSILKYLPQGVQDELTNSDLVNGISQIMDPVLSAATDAASSANLLVCACKAATSSGLMELGNAVGSCADAALCFLGAQSGCDCGNPPANIYLDCADITQQSDPGVIPANAIPDYSSVVKLSDEYYCYGCLSYMGCLPATICHCAAPMHFEQKATVIGDYYWECDCPSGSHKAGSGALAHVCVCDGASNQLINADGTCPPPPPKCAAPNCPGNQVAHKPNPLACDYTCGCPAGLTQAGDKCVTPCADPRQVMLVSGSCCTPSQASSCGTCCPIGMQPDDKTGLCISLPPITHPTLPPQTTIPPRGNLSLPK